MFKIKKIIVLLILAVVILTLCSCGRTYEEAENNPSGMSGNYFIIVKEWGSATRYGYSYIVYANDTKVMYYIEYAGHGRMITPLYNADGTLQVYKGE